MAQDRRCQRTASSVKPTMTESAQCAMKQLREKSLSNVMTSGEWLRGRCGPVERGQWRTYHTRLTAFKAELWRHMSTLQFFMRYLRGARGRHTQISVCLAPLCTIAGLVLTQKHWLLLATAQSDLLATRVLTKQSSARWVTTQRQGQRQLFAGCIPTVNIRSCRIRYTYEWFQL